MGYAFTEAGFEAYDVHMTDLQAGRARLDEFKGFVACGGFSYGDTLGAGMGWARSILFNAQLAEQFNAFFGRPDTFALGVCNGCQMLAELADIIPGARPGRASPATAASSTRPGCRWSRCWIARHVLRRHGRQPPADRGGARRGLRRLLAARRRGQGASRRCASSTTTGRPTEAYPFNPNGSPGGLTAVTTADGRFTAMMPHPERVFRNVQMSWTSGERSDESPWMRMFGNARRELG